MNEYNAYPIIKDLYYINDTNIESEEDIMDNYTKSENENDKGLEVPDMLSNINSNHLYKLISSKDIDFNNAFLKNSSISEQAWGSFDPNRRWPSGYPIHINDVYELMNVVDYLLCATNDLWSEINKMKYSGNIINNIWFLNNLNQPINSIYAIDTSQFTKNSDYSILLDPTKYYTILPETMENFGIGTLFIAENNNEKITRNIIQTNNNRSGINASIKYKPEDTKYYKMQVENINGINTNIYGYLIEDLKFYPMFNIDNFFYAKKDENNFDNLVDKINKKLNYDIYFRTVEADGQGVNKSTFHKVFVDFLYFNYESVGYPYILYYIDETTQLRNIIYIHTTENQQGSQLYKEVQTISNDLSIYSEYINYFYDTSNSLNDLGSQNVVFYVDNSIAYPYLYHISDMGTINLFIETPNTSSFNMANANLMINYYKKTNNIIYSIHTNEISNNTLQLMNDVDQMKSLLNSPKRYYIPDNTDIYVVFSAPFLKNNLNIKFDDEYTDVLVRALDFENTIYVETDEEAQQYYYYNGLDNDGKRQFIQFNSANELNTIATSNNNNIIYIADIDQRKSIHLYKKIENAYDIKYDLFTNSLVKQYIEEYDLVKQEVENIEDHIELSLYDEEDEDKINYLKLTNYSLPEEYEQIKFDINLRIDETSKVSKSETNIPMSINRIHHPCIQFISKTIMEAEIKDYTRLAYTFADTKTTAFVQTQYSNRTTTPIMKTTEIDSENRKTNQNIINGETVDDQFYTFSEVYEYLITSKYNDFLTKNYKNFVETNKRTDLLYYINVNERNNSQYQTLEESFNYNTTYDNTISGSNMIVFNYDLNQKYMPIFGSVDILKDKLKLVTNNQVTSFLTSATIEKVDGAPNDESMIVTNSQNVEYIKFESLFNINGFGFNYRQHGGDSYLYINRENGPRNISNSNRNHTFSDQYDLLTNPCANNFNNICKFMEFTVDDNNNQFTTITKLGNDVEENGILINNDILDINLYSFEHKVQNDYEKIRTGRVNAMSETTYYIPTSYMAIKNTTFFPDRSILPKNEEYDFNDYEDFERYKRYIEFWDSTNEENKYKPITLSLQLKENLENNVPFFTESNIAKAKFDIHRSDIGNTGGLSVSGKLGNNVPFVILGQRYYLIDFLNVSNQSNLSIGSYPKYNGNGYFEIIDINKLDDVFPELFFIKKENGNYIYDIKKISSINKVMFTNSQNIKFISGLNEIDIELDNNTLDKNYLFYLDINDTFINQLIDNISINYITDEISFVLNITGLYGNKLYKNASIASNMANVKFKLTKRTLPELVNMPVVIIEDMTGGERVQITGTIEDPENPGQQIPLEEFTFLGKRYRQYQFKKYEGINNYEFLEYPQLTNNLCLYQDNERNIIPFNYDESTIRDYYKNGSVMIDLFNHYYIFEYLGDVNNSNINENSEGEEDNSGQDQGD